ncbi:MAG: hypothetical protein ACK56W_11740 [Pirellula sp.]|jgi:hypothetical protein
MLPRQQLVTEAAKAIPISKRMTKRSVIVPVSLCLLDIVLTLCGQSSAYWDGEFRDVTEASPAFATYLAIHPVVFVVAGLMWIAVFTILVTTLPASPGRFVATAFSIGHAVGALAWLVRIFRELVGGMEHGSEKSPSPLIYFAFVLLIVLIAFFYSLLGSKPRNSP